MSLYEIADRSGRRSIIVRPYRENNREKATKRGQDDNLRLSLLLFKVRRIDLVFLQKIVEIGAIFSRKGCGVAHIPLCELKEPAEIAFFE